MPHPYKWSVDDYKIARQYAAFLLLESERIDGGGEIDEDAIEETKRETAIRKYGRIKAHN